MCHIYERVFVALIFAGALPAPATQADPSLASPQITLEHRFDAAIDIGETRDWLKQMSSEPNHVGSPHDRTNAEWEVAEFTKFGWDAHFEKIEVLYPTAMSTLARQLP